MRPPVSPDDCVSQARSVLYARLELCHAANAVELDDPERLVRAFEDAQQARASLGATASADTGGGETPSLAGRERLTNYSGTSTAGNAAKGDIDEDECGQANYSGSAKSDLGLGLDLDPHATEGSNSRDGRRPGTRVIVHRDRYRDRGKGRGTSRIDGDISIPDIGTGPVLPPMPACLQLELARDPSRREVLRVLDRMLGT